MLSIESNNTPPRQRQSPHKRYRGNHEAEEETKDVDNGLNPYLSRLDGFQGVRDVCRLFGAEGEERDQADVLDEGG